MGLLTASQIREKVNPDVSFDTAYFDLNIDYVEESIIKPILTPDLYDDVVANPNDYDVLLPMVEDALAFAVAFVSYEKDLERQTVNQGIMENSTQYTKSADNAATLRTLSKIKDREYYYCAKLGQHLIDNKDNYDLFDITKISYEPNLRRFFPI
jgi:hypothetical protein